MLRTLTICLALLLSGPAMACDESQNCPPQPPDQTDHDGGKKDEPPFDPGRPTPRNAHHDKNGHINDRPNNGVDGHGWESPATGNGRD